MKQTTLLIMAAGLGSRYGGNKQVDGLGPHGEMLMQYSIYDAVCAGFTKLVFVIKPEHRALIEPLCCGLSGVEVCFVYQDFSSIPTFFKIPEERVKPFGTVHAVLCAADVIHEPFAVINADDFYGADAFHVMHEALLSLREGEAAMVAYSLRNTVSPSGAVTRGICRVEDGQLRGVTETYKITLDADGSIRDAECGRLDPNSAVSMNLWGFLPESFSAMRSSFDAFLHATPPEDLRAEYALPAMVDRLIGEKRISVRVLTTDAVWFGVTYREDREGVAEALRRMHAEGQYPERLL